MKSRALLLFVLLCSAVYQSSAKKQEDYAVYHEGILKAEHQLANNELASALSTYVSLFKQFGFVFARDAYNALQVAVITKRLKDRDDLLLICAKSGVSEIMLATNMLIRASYKGSEALFEETYKKGYTHYLRRIDTVLRKEMMERYQLEQASKRQANFLQVTTDNFKRIQQLANEGRFPAEQIIGVRKGLDYGDAFPTLLHYPYAYVALYDQLWLAVRKGQLQPLSLIYLYGFNQTRTSTLYADSMKEHKELFKLKYNVAFGLESANEREVDNARRSVWLRPQADTRMISNIAKMYGMEFREGW